ncbi:diguanylate cyclase [Plesiomonas shigelloides]|uniref:GGDEF domain-containing protein n=1 Tax=Plesiomonas shigelloides TaxID=703 RepID=UPI001261A99D|nr:GGDEF domain-containing protein [Plesiomonas shigelloides]KAB7703058.1 diguanylate cyclase [Plesiomonas shigelloides]
MRRTSQKPLLLISCCISLFLIICLLIDGHEDERIANNDIVFRILKELINRETKHLVNNINELCLLDMHDSIANRSSVNADLISASANQLVSGVLVNDKVLILSNKTSLDIEPIKDILETRYVYRGNAFISRAQIDGINVIIVRKECNNKYLFTVYNELEFINLIAHEMKIIGEKAFSIYTYDHKEKTFINILSQNGSQLNGKDVYILDSYGLIFKITLDDSKILAHKLKFFIAIIPIVSIFTLLMISLKFNEQELKKKTKQYADAFEMATTDPMTGLKNRRWLDIHLSNKLFNKGNGCVIMMDIDYFKKINDIYGHGVGDMVIKKFSSIIVSLMKKKMFSIRWGGEEFVIIMMNASKNSAIELCEKLRDEMSYRISLPDGEKVNFSAGVAEYFYGDVFYAINCADKKLYDAKRGGRGITVH